MLQDKELADYMPILKRLLSLLEVAIVILSAVLAHFLVTFLRDGAIWWPWPDGYRLIVTVAAFLTIFIFHDFGLYQGWRGESFLHEIRRVVVAWSAVFVCLIIFTVATKTSAIYSRYWTVAWFLLTVVLLWMGRLGARTLLHTIRSRGSDRKKIVIVGTGVAAKAVLKALKNNPWAGYDVEGYFGNSEIDDIAESTGVPWLGGYDRITQYLQNSGNKEVWIALSGEEHQLFRKMSSSLSDLTADVRYVPDLFNFKLLNASVSHVAGVPLVNMSRSPMVGLNNVLKSMEDKVIASVALVIFMPLMLLIAIAIKINSPGGPVIFKQRRHGWHGQTFEVYKFRTMHLHNEPKGNVIQASVYDRRVFPLGRFLRRTSLDELPQFLNVLQGGMSIVGPRPHAVEHNNQYGKLIDNYAWRHKVKPGITGWAQVNGYRGETRRLEDMVRRIEYDLYYIEHWSLWFDIKIILLTLIRGWVGRKAY